MYKVKIKNSDSKTMHMIEYVIVVDYKGFCTTPRAMKYKVWYGV